MAADRARVTIEDAKLIFKNFEGREGLYNAKGQRSVCVVLDPDTAARMAEDGWNIKATKVREDGDEPELYLPVQVSYKNYPPNIFQINSKGKRTRITEDMVETMDWISMKSVDIVVNGSDWTMPSGDSGRKAYLKTMFVILDEDDLERKYAEEDQNKPSEPSD